jgi:CBS domain containing-hemolysin-like protein
MSTQKKNGCKTNESGKEPPSKKDAKKKSRVKWVVTAFLLSFVISAVFSVAMGEVTANANILVAVLLLLFFIALGILFDVVGLAVATADASPFHSMAARRLRAGKKGVWLIANSDKVSSVCNDIVGDICGVVTGAAGAAIVAKLFADGAMWYSLAVTSLISALTVGGKAACKSFAMKHSDSIVMFVAKSMCFYRK